MKNRLVYVSHEGAMNRCVHSFFIDDLQSSPLEGADG